MHKYNICKCSICYINHTNTFLILSVFVSHILIFRCCVGEKLSYSSAITVLMWMFYFDDGVYQGSISLFSQYMKSCKICIVLRIRWQRNMKHNTYAWVITPINHFLTFSYKHRVKHTIFCPANCSPCQYLSISEQSFPLKCLFSGHQEVLYRQDWPAISVRCTVQMRVHFSDSFIFSTCFIMAKAVVERICIFDAQ